MIYLVVALNSQLACLHPSFLFPALYVLEVAHYSGN